MKAVSSAHPSDHAQAAPLAAWSRVAKDFGTGRTARRALDGFSLALQPGTVTGLAGLNGAGKTTALKILLGLAFADTGHVDRDTSLDRAGAVAFVPEDSAHPHLLTCREIVTSHAALIARGSQAALAAAEAALVLCGLPDAQHLPARALSKGMARRLSLAAALVTDPLLLVLDEPQSGLDPLGRRDLGKILAERRGRGAAVLIASHDLSEIERWCDRIAVVHAGRIVAEHRPGPGMPPLVDRFFDLVSLRPEPEAVSPAPASPS